MSESSAVPVKCDACGGDIEGASVWYFTNKYHPWCWHTQQREKLLPGLDHEPQQAT